MPWIGHLVCFPVHYYRSNFFSNRPISFHLCTRQTLNVHAQMEMMISCSLLALGAAGVRPLLILDTVYERQKPISLLSLPCSNLTIRISKNGIHKIITIVIKMEYNQQLKMEW